MEGADAYNCIKGNNNYLNSYAAKVKGRIKKEYPSE